MNLKAWLQEEEEKREKAKGEWPRNVDGIRTAAELIWMKPLHHYYTDHSVDHSERIIEKLSKLTEEPIQAHNMSSTEVFILLASAYLHDIGMQDERSLGNDLDQIRIHHHELTRKIITDRYVQQSKENVPLGFSDLVPVDIVNIIASVAEAHRQTNLRESRYEKFTYGNQTIRPGFMAALLRLADELDIDHRRVVDMPSLNLMQITPKSKFHWFLHYYVSGVEIQNGLITVSYLFPEERKDYERIIEPLVRGKIQEEFPTLQNILREHGCKVQMSDKHEVRLVSGLECMSSEVFDFAVGELRERHTKRIAYHNEEIHFCDSKTQAEHEHASGEFR